MEQNSLVSEVLSMDLEGAGREGVPATSPSTQNIERCLNWTIKYHVSSPKIVPGFTSRFPFPLPVFTVVDKSLAHITVTPRGYFTMPEDFGVRVESVISTPILALEPVYPVSLDMMQDVH
jgi:hypothetical protein